MSRVLAPQSANLSVPQGVVVLDLGDSFLYLVRGSSVACLLLHFVDKGLLFHVERHV